MHVRPRRADALGLHDDDFGDVEVFHAGDDVGVAVGHQARRGDDGGEGGVGCSGRGESYYDDGGCIFFECGPDVVDLRWRAFAGLMI